MSESTDSNISETPQIINNISRKVILQFLISFARKTLFLINNFTDSPGNIKQDINFKWSTGYNILE